MEISCVAMIRILYQRSVEKYRFQPHFTRFPALRNSKGQKNRSFSRLGTFSARVRAVFPIRGRMG